MRGSQTVDTQLNHVRVSSYKGITSFHKYWGKKPPEHWKFFIENFSSLNDIVLDPFLGSGLISIEAVRLNRRFIGYDINPVSHLLTKMYHDMPSAELMKIALENLKKTVMPQILESYRLENGGFASHYLWENSEIVSVWQMPSPRRRIESEPSQYDNQIFDSFINYSSKYLKSFNVFDNSRINTKDIMTVSDIFSPRALRNIDLIIEGLSHQNKHTQDALMLSLTSISGQISKMVFAITGRGKTTGNISKKIEVGSWAIGYWRPNIHFEINVWRVFEKKVNELINIIQGEKFDSTNIATDFSEIINDKQKIFISTGDSENLIGQLPDKSIHLVLTDPPHADRIPYLELSAMWNTIIGNSVNYEDELVISNAKLRMKNNVDFNVKFSKILTEMARVTKDDGYIIVMYNSRVKSQWECLTSFCAKNKDFILVGSLPVKYSVSSLVQDNRRGSLSEDFAIIFKRATEENKSQLVKLRSYGLNKSIPEVSKK